MYRPHLSTLNYTIAPQITDWLIDDCVRRCVTIANDGFQLRFVQLFAVYEWSSRLRSHSLSCISWCCKQGEVSRSATAQCIQKCFKLRLVCFSSCHYCYIVKSQHCAKRFTATLELVVELAVMTRSCKQCFYELLRVSWKANCSSITQEVSRFV